MADHDADSSSLGRRRRGREDITSATVSITPIPVEDAEAGYDAAGLPITDKPHLSSEPESLITSVTPRPGPSVAKYLFTSERYVGEWRRHWIKIVGWIVLGALSPFIVGYVVGLIGSANSVATWVLLAVWFVGLLFIAWQVYEWWHERFVLTNKRVMLITGVFSRRVAMMPLARVTDMAYEQSLLGMMLNYGSFILESAGQDQALTNVKPLPHPRELYLLFCQEMYDPDAVDAGARANSPEGDHSDH
ncbi:MAG: PH domain-containing protein [Mycobacteriales bacterium]